MAGFHFVTVSKPGVELKRQLTQEEIDWIDSVLENIAHGEIRLIICEKRIVKILTEVHKIYEKPLDRKRLQDISSG